MALTPDEVVNQKFTITKFRDGYDLDQVDDFLDTIVEQLRQDEQEKAELQEQLDAANARIEELTAELESARAGAAESAQPSQQTIVVDAPAATPQAVSTAAPADAVKSSAMLQLALELHDKYVSEGESQRDKLIREAETESRRLLEDAQRQRSEELRKLGDERQDMQAKIKELREFESEYRGTLRSYIQSQLRSLEGSPEPEGAPQGLE